MEPKTSPQAEQAVDKSSLVSRHRGRISVRFPVEDDAEDAGEEAGMAAWGVREDEADERSDIQLLLLKAGELGPPLVVGADDGGAC
mmetsp:Transcript_2657/g.8545  ORF Transcript_2657/g.8545 Transcript_2657/m.8545 type:complete len:86 (+) Transcript_2657:1567-1824(+)